MLYDVAERFKSVQGEGKYVGVPMAFIRFVGCSVGKKICTHCDTDFMTPLPWLGGGSYTPEELAEWVGDYDHVCLTGGEPLNNDLTPFYRAVTRKTIHIETSGTIAWLPGIIEGDSPGPQFNITHLCVSPKPGFLDVMIQRAHEIKVIVPGLGNGDGWPSLHDALTWANQGKTVYLQPRNAKHDINSLNLALCEKLVTENPSLRLSIQVHKLLRVR